MAGSQAIAQARGGNGVLPFAQRRSSNPASTVIPGRAPARTRNPFLHWIPDRLAMLGVRNDELKIHDKDFLHGDP